ncbi:MAG TPA: class I SAM-dependent methyltransferase [Polaromonas sp.]|nr:class I SAM-dependent methyltransferase [Polaromonas sp.]
MSETLNCPICGSGDTIIVFSTFDDRYAYPGHFNLLKCGHCAHMFLQGRFTPEVLQDLYTNYYPRSAMDIASYRPHMEMSAARSWLEGAKSGAFRWVPKGVTVLDIGCGFCESLGYYKARGCDAYGVEADANARRIAEQYGFNVQIGLFEASLFKPDMFDYVTMSQVIEHVTDPVHTLHEIATVLKPNGVAILSTPNASGWGARLFGKYWINWHTPYHLQFFSEESITAAAKKAGLKVVQTKTVTSSSWIIYQMIHMLDYPVPGCPSSYWAKTGIKPNFAKRVIRKIVAATRLLLIPQMLTRVMDALSIGDNRIIVLKKDVAPQTTP